MMIIDDAQVKLKPIVQRTTKPGAYPGFVFLSHQLKLFSCVHSERPMQKSPHPTHIATQKVGTLKMQRRNFVGEGDGVVVPTPQVDILASSVIKRKKKVCNSYFGMGPNPAHCLVQIVLKYSMRLKK